MKLFYTLFLLFSFSSFAQPRQEYDENLEKICHLELKKIGCLKNDLEDKKCAEGKKEKLSPRCRELHDVQVNQK